MMRIVGKCGKKPAVYDPRSYNLTAPLAKALPKIPLNILHADKAQFPMWGNAQYGDCALVSAHSAVLSWTTCALTPVIASDDMVLDDYADVTGFRRDEPATDQGTDVLAMLKYWQKSGMRRPGNQAGNMRSYLTEYGYINPRDHDTVARAIAMLGGVLVGMTLPRYIAQTNPPQWALLSGVDMTPAGGHMIFARGYNHLGIIGTSWTQEILIRWSFLDAMCDEMWSGISRQDWLTTDGLTPMGENLDCLESELKATSG